MNDNNIKFIDLGLPSGTLWAEGNEEGFYNYKDAVKKYGNQLPTREQFEELYNRCQWEWMGDVYKVIGPNGNTIVLPAAGSRSCYGGVYFVGRYGEYWSSTPNGSDYAWVLNFYSYCMDIANGIQRGSRSVRLVK